MNVKFSTKFVAASAAAVMAFVPRGLLRRQHG